MHIQVYDEVFKPLGVKSREVITYKKEIPFENTVQLILEVAEEKLDLKNYPME